MCTAIAQGRFFGRNLDLEYGYNEQLIVTPRHLPLQYRRAKTLLSHYAIIGMATVDQGYPLYFDAVNEKGLAMAGLDFPGNAYYAPEQRNRTNIAPFELIPWVLSQCSTVKETKNLLAETHVADIAYSEKFPQAPLHWIVADQEGSIVLEPMRDGLKIYDNPVGVLTNNPPFPYHMDHLAGFQQLSAGTQQHNIESLNLIPYGGGMGAIGLPGDFSSPSRFVKCAFVKLHSSSAQADPVTQFFHLLDTVAMPAGAVRVRGDQNEITRYSCCCDLTEGIYYYVTYGNRRIQAAKLYDQAIDGSALICFQLPTAQDVRYHNS